jgi:NADPH:quinone reductase-like Zn-dependent oxidoreductase
MKAYHIDRFGSIGGIVRRSAEDPRPGPKEVLMRVRASSLNYRDLMVLKGGGRGPTKLGVIPLSDGAGDVEAVGEGVTRVKVGDRIAGCFHARWYGGPIKPDGLVTATCAGSKWGKADQVFKPPSQRLTIALSLRL